MNVVKTTVVLSMLFCSTLLHSVDFMKNINSPYFYYPLINASTLFLSIGCASLVGYCYGYSDGIKNNVPAKVNLPSKICSTTKLLDAQKKYLRFVHQKNKNIVSTALGAFGISVGGYLLYKNRNRWGGVNTISSLRMPKSTIGSISFITAVSSALILSSQQLYESYLVRAKGCTNNFEDKLCTYHAIWDAALCAIYLSYSL